VTLKNDSIESLGELIDYMITKRLADTHTSLPGIIESFDAATQTAKVNVAIKRVRDVRNADGTYTEIPTQIAPILNVPVQFPSGGGFHITFPVAKGDECLLVFQERSIDRWQQQSGIQKPLDRRMHEYTDAIAIVGIKSSPNAISDISTDSLQIRNDDGTTFIDVTDSEIILDINGGGATFSVDKSVSFANGATITPLGDFVSAGGISLSSHVHSGVTTGSGTTAGPQ
jgi:hypothetical protein